MGYTHYFQNTQPFTAAQWSSVQALALKIFNLTESRGIELRAEFDNEFKPIVNSKKIVFNGYQEEGHETFVVSRSPCNEFCKTAQKPYDAAVVALLIVCAGICPTFTWGSDGEGTDFDDAKDLLKAINY